MKLHEQLSGADIIHRINYSGRWKLDKNDKKRANGFHIYMFVNPNVTYKEYAARCVHQTVASQLTLFLRGKGVNVVPKQYKTEIIDGKEVRKEIPEEDFDDNTCYPPVDETTIGDLRRVSRVTNTWNVKRERYCIPLNEKSIRMTPCEMYDLAAEKVELEQSCWFGGKLYQIPAEFDKPGYVEEYNAVSMEGVAPNFEILSNLNLPLCVRRFMGVPSLDNGRTFQLLCYFRDSGIHKEEAKEILKSFMTEDKFLHRTLPSHVRLGGRPCEGMLDRVYEGKQTRLLMKNCDKIRILANLNLEECIVCPRFSQNSPVYMSRIQL
jgi:hypothetical protein